MTAAKRRVLLDACVPQELRHRLSVFDVMTARYANLHTLKNGALLAAAEGRFDVLVTVDASMAQQQNLHGRTLSIVVARVKANRLPELLALLPQLRAAVQTVSPGHVAVVRG